MNLVEGLPAMASVSMRGRAMIGCQYKYMDRFYVRAFP
jgi:hypothetical protein